MMYFHHEYCLFRWLPSLYPASFLYLRLTDIGHHLKISMSKNKFIFPHTSFPSWHLLCFCHFCYPFKCLGLPVSGPNFTLPLLPCSVTKTCQFSLYRVLEPFPLASPTHYPCPGFKSITIPAPPPHWSLFPQFHSINCHWTKVIPDIFLQCWILEHQINNYSSSGIGKASLWE